MTQTKEGPTLSGQIDNTSELSITNIASVGPRETSSCPSAKHHKEPMEIGSRPNSENPSIPIDRAARLMRAARLSEDPTEYLADMLKASVYGCQAIGMEPQEFMSMVLRMWEQAEPKRSEG